MAKIKVKSKLKPSTKPNLNKRLKLKNPKMKKPLKHKFNQKKQTNGNPKVDFGSMSIDEFMSKGFENSDNESSNEDIFSSTDKIEEHSSSKNAELNKNNDSIRSNDDLGELPLDGFSDEEVIDDDGSTGDYESEIKSHKASLDKLKHTDPEFYKFLQENDKRLLQFNVSDSEEEIDEADKIHKPTGELEIASDESDFEADEDDQGEDRVQNVTLKMLKSWRASLQTDKTNKTISSVVQAFHAALLSVSNKDNETCRYKVEGSAVFNAVIQLCVLEISPAIRRFLRLTTKTKTAPHKCKKFVKIKAPLKTYFTDLLKLLGGVTSTNILTVLLKHLHQVSLLFISFPNISKPTLKRLIRLWGTGDEVVRVLAFLCIVRITNNQSISLLDTTLKTMYMTYVINSKFVSVATLSSINFMRRSLVEMFTLDPATSYQHVFLYIRQLAIHLRNAMTVHKKENIQAVYNWQFVNSLKLWGNLLAATYDKKELQPLVYPFVQVCLGTVKLVPTAQYYPLRFHVVQVLIEFSRSTGVFIPILPSILDVLNMYDFNKKHKKASMKPLNFTCVLRMSNSQLEEHGFKDTVIENVYGLLLEYLASQSHSIAFPDLSLPCIIQIKQFINKCKISSYNKKMKQILEKIQQNSEFIEKQRRDVTFNLTEFNKIAAWEIAVKNKGTPMDTFYNEWNKVRTIKKNKEATNADSIGDYNLPMIKKVKKNAGKEARDGPANPFPSDSDSDDELNFGIEEKEEESKTGKKRSRKRKKALKKTIRNEDVSGGTMDDEDGPEDIVEDLDIADW